MFHRLERGFMPHSHEMKKARGILFECQADCILAGVGQSAVAVGYVDREEIHITKRKRVIARLLPPDPVAPAAFPDFLARQKKAFGKKRLKVSGAEQLAAERERF